MFQRQRPFPDFFGQMIKERTSWKWERIFFEWEQVNSMDKYIITKTRLCVQTLQKRRITTISAVATNTRRTSKKKTRWRNAGKRRDPPFMVPPFQYVQSSKNRYSLMTYTLWLLVFSQKKKKKFGYSYFVKKQQRKEPEQIWCPNDRKVFRVHIGEMCTLTQFCQMAYQIFRRPKSTALRNLCYYLETFLLDELTTICVTFGDIVL